MNIKTFIILFLLGLLCSCSYERRFGETKEEEQESTGANRVR
jgi:hypothetical protein